MAVFTEDVSQALPMNEVVTTSIHSLIPMGGVVQSLPMTQTVIANLTKSPKNQTVSHTIAVAQTLSHEAVRSAVSGISVGQTITVNRESVKHVSQSLPMAQYVAAWKTTYHWIAPGVGAPSTRSTLRLEWDVNNVELRNPKLGDKDSYEASRINRESRGNDLIIYRDPMWPDQEILSFEFEYLTSAQAIELLDFMAISLGQLITLTDQYARVWHGFIITPDSEVMQNKRVGYTAKFDFQGTLA